MRLAILSSILLFTATAQALEPVDVWLIVNKNEPESRRVADHYMARRGVPKGNVIELDLPRTEDISRADYDAKLAGPLREALKSHKDRVKVLLTTYGVPLSVGQQPPSVEEQKELEKLRPELDAVRKRIVEFEKKKDVDKQGLEQARALAKKLNDQIYQLAHAESQACVDSELMLLWWPKYELMRWVFNPLNFQASEDYRKRCAPVIMTCRLDGPTPAIARRLVDDAVAAEAI
jgi:uncharacterized protein (TIGR03790 family)